MSQTPFRLSLLIQMRVIAALLMREIITRFGRHNIGFLWLFVEPMLFTLGVTALWTFMSATHSTHGSSFSIVAFAVTGYSSVLLWRNMPGRTTHAILPNAALMYHRNVKVMDIYWARLILEWAGATASFLVLATIFTTIGYMDPPKDIMTVLYGWGLLTWFGMSLALAIGTLSERSEIVDKIWHPLSYILFPMSGAAFLVDWLPKQAQDIVLYLPMVHGIEMVREGYFGTSIHAHYSVMYVVTFCLFATALGLLQARIVSQKVEHS